MFHNESYTTKNLVGLSLPFISSLNANTYVPYYSLYNKYRVTTNEDDGIMNYYYVFGKHNNNNIKTREIANILTGNTSQSNYVNNVYYVKKKINYFITFGFVATINNGKLKILAGMFMKTSDIIGKPLMDIEHDNREFLIDVDLLTNSLYSEMYLYFKKYILNDITVNMSIKQELTKFCFSEASVNSISIGFNQLNSYTDRLKSYVSKHDNYVSLPHSFTTELLDEEEFISLPHSFTTELLDGIDTSVLQTGSVLITGTGGNMDNLVEFENIFADRNRYSRSFINPLEFIASIDFYKANISTNDVLVTNIESVRNLTPPTAEEFNNAEEQVQDVNLWDNPPIDAILENDGNHIFEEVDVITEVLTDSNEDDDIQVVDIIEDAPLTVSPTPSSDDRIEYGFIDDESRILNYD